MQKQIGRRAVFQPIAALSLAVIAPGVLLGCSKGSQCSEAKGLSPEEQKTRNEVAQYQDQSTDANKHCSLCSLFEPAPSGGCGGCKVVKGPISANGYCKLFVAKTAG